MCTYYPGIKNKRFGDTKLLNENFSLSALVAHITAKQVNRKFKIYEATVAKTLLKISISSLSVIMSICLTFESERNYPGGECRGAVSKLGKKYQIRVCVFRLSMVVSSCRFVENGKEMYRSEKLSRRACKVFVLVH